MGRRACATAAVESTLWQAATGVHGKAPKQYVIRRDVLRTQVHSPQELLSQTVLVPNAGGGYLLREVQPDGLVEKFGLRAGDVIRSANGQAVNSADDIRRIYQQLSDARHLRLEILRDGKNEQWLYEIR